jgi:hypothetical protein
VLDTGARTGGNGVKAGEGAGCAVPAADHVADCDVPVGCELTDAVALAGTETTCA